MPSPGDRIQIVNRTTGPQSANGRFGTYHPPRGILTSWVILDGDQEKRYFYNTSIRATMVVRPAPLVVDIRPGAPPARPIPGRADIASLEVRVQGIGVIIANAQAELQAVMEELAAMRIQSSH